MQRFVRNLKIKAKLLKEGTVCHGEVTEEEIAQAELQWLRSVQKNLKAQANYGHLEHEFGLYEDENEIVRDELQMPIHLMKQDFQPCYHETITFRPC